MGAVWERWIRAREKCLLLATEITTGRTRRWGRRKPKGEQSHQIVAVQGRWEVGVSNSI